MFPNASFNTCRPCRRAKARTRSAAISSFLLQAARVMPGLSVVSCPIRCRSSQTSEMHESRWEGVSVIQSLSATTVRSCLSANATASNGAQGAVGSGSLTTTRLIVHAIAGRCRCDDERPGTRGRLRELYANEDGVNGERRHAKQYRHA